MKPNVYLLSEETLKQRTVVSDNLDTKLLQQVIWDCQESTLQTLIGTPLYNRLIAGVIANTLTVDEQELLNDYLTNVMVFLVLSELPMVLGYKFYNKNILKKTAENAEAASMTELVELMKYYKNKSEFYQERAIKYILRRYNDDSVFTEYLDTTESDHIVPKKSGYKSTIVL
jgi:hypothetical protein